MGDDDDPFQGPMFKEFAAGIRKNMLPMVNNSAMGMMFFNDKGDDDVQQAMELGFLILMDKPIVLVVSPGAKPNEHLVRVADTIIEFGPHLEEALREFMKSRGLVA